MNRLSWLPVQPERVAQWLTGDQQGYVAISLGRHGVQLGFNRLQSLDNLFRHGISFSLDEKKPPGGGLRDAGLF